MDQQNVVYPYNGIYSGIKKEWSTDTSYNMDEPWRYYAKWKKPDTKGHMLYGVIYMKFPEQANYIETESRAAATSGWKMWWGVTPNGYVDSFWSDKNVLRPDSGYGCIVLRIYEKPFNCTLKE